MIALATIILLAAGQRMRLVILEVLSNPLLWGWGHSGDLTADFAPVVGNLTPRIVKSPVLHEIDKCISAKL